MHLASKAKSNFSPLKRGLDGSSQGNHIFIKFLLCAKGFLNSSLLPSGLTLGSYINLLFPMFLIYIIETNSRDHHL